jgi:FAD/FMN-containing dehydrogenase
MGVSMGDDSVVGALQSVFAGVLVAPAGAPYETARRVWNGMVDRRPAVIARCANDSDIAAALRVAVEYELPVAVRGGGHNVAGQRCL